MFLSTFKIHKSRVQINLVFTVVFSIAPGFKVGMNECPRSWKCVLNSQVCGAVGIHIVLTLNYLSSSIFPFVVCFVVRNLLHPSITIHIWSVASRCWGGWCGRRQKCTGLSWPRVWYLSIRVVLGLSLIGPCCLPNKVHLFSMALKTFHTIWPQWTLLSCFHCIFFFSIAFCLCSGLMTFNPVCTLESPGEL